MPWLLTAIHDDRRMFDSLWYAAFPPETAPENVRCDVDAVLEGK